MANFKKTPRPTLKTLSELTGLSLSTVSLALRGGENLKSETRQKVLDAAAQTGYVPDPASVKLRTGKSHALALILDGEEDSVGFSRELIRGVNDGARELGYTLKVIPEFDQTHSLKEIHRILGRRSADGVIITHTQPQDARIKLLLEQRFPFVTHGRTELLTPHPYHDFDSSEFVRIGVERLVTKGARKLLAIVSGHKTFHSYNIKQQFLSQCSRMGVEGEIFDDHARLEEHVGATRDLGLRLAGTQDGFDGILSDSELATIGLASGFRDAGVRIGDSVQIVSKQTSSLLPILFPEVDRLEERIHRSGEELASLLVRCINGAPAEDLQTLAPPMVHFSD